VTDFAALIRQLTENEVEFIIVGGAAATAHGSARLTMDLDVVYSRSTNNIHKVVKALEPIQPYLRGAPPGLPFEWSVETIQKGLNFTLTTSLGALDLLGEIVGGGGYEQLFPHTVRLEIGGVECLCLGLERLIEVKRAAGRPKDLETVAELERIKEERMPHADDQATRQISH
jgi:predicted nucleotidyltransferase